MWPRHGESPDNIKTAPLFGPFGLQEFQARRHRLEQVPHLDHRAAIKRGRLRGGDSAGINPDLPAMARTGSDRTDDKLRHRTDRGQRLAAETEKPDIVKAAVGKLGGGMAADGK